MTHSHYHETQHHIMRNIITASSVEQIQEALSDLPQDTIVFSDVDDTIFTPCAGIFSSSSCCSDIIDYIKQERVRFRDFERILSAWRLGRKVQLVDPKWPEFARQARERWAFFGLTQMATGRLGAIESTQRWRFQELSTLGITFSRDGVFEAFENKDAAAGYYEGIFMTGTLSKGQVVQSALDLRQFGGVVLIDDRMGHLQSAQEVCQHLSARYLGVHFTGRQRVLGTFNRDLAYAQVFELMVHHRWMEDEKMRELLDVSSFCRQPE